MTTTVMDTEERLAANLAEVFCDIFTDVGEWQPHGSEPELAGAYTRTFAEAGLPGAGFVLHMPAVGKRFLFTLTEG